MANGKLLHPNKVVTVLTLLCATTNFWVTDVELNEHITQIPELITLDSEKLQLSDGDLIFRAGHDLVSNLILAQGDGTRFSHVGIVLTGKSGVEIAHAIPEDSTSQGGVVLEPITSFASEKNSVETHVYRVKGMNMESRKKIKDYLLRQIGKPFDADFSMNDSSKMYCTELALKALAAGGINIDHSLPRIRMMLLTEPVLPPDTLRYSKLLEQVI